MDEDLNWGPILGAYSIKVINGIVNNLIIVRAFEIFEGPVVRVRGHAYPSSLSLITITLASALLNVICGYLVAVWASNHKMAHARALMWLTLATYIFMFFTGLGISHVVFPNWYLLARLATSIFYLVGAWLRVTTYGTTNEVE